jgi:Tfp pilus assembly protein PilV
MKFKPALQTSVKRARAGFTLAEALAALMFLAIVIPVAMHGLQVASLAGEVGQRKAVAARLGNKILNELKAERQLQSSGQNGNLQFNGVNYKWAVKTELWTQDATLPMLQATVTVSFPAQGRTYDVSLSTLVAQPTS